MVRRLLQVLLALAVSLGACQLALADPPAVQAAARPAQEQQVLVLLRLAPEHLRPEQSYGGGYGEGPGVSARRRIAARLAKNNGLTVSNSWPMPLLGVDCFVMTVPPGRSPAEVAALLSRDREVEWSEPMSIYRAQRAVQEPNDPLFRAQPAAREWRLADLHEMATGRNVVVAVVDSAIETTHPDLVGQIQTSRDFVPEHPVSSEEHGTGVAGIISARANNSLGIAGVAPAARLMGLRACWQLSGANAGTICDSLSLAEALHFAIEHRAQVINLSLSGPPDPLLGQLLDVALSRGVVVVGAYDRSLPAGGFPASHAGVVAVVDETPEPPRAGVYSAPGRDIPTTQPGGRWYLVNGSSFAAAHVSGLFALLREHATRPAPAAAMLVTRPRGGFIDACATLVRSVGGCDCACARADGAVAAIVRR